MILRQLILLAALALATGCARLHTIQTDASPERTITTEINATAILTGAQIIEKLKATTTDKTQSIGANAVGQEAVSANAVKFMESAERIAEKLSPRP